MVPQSSRRRSRAAGLGASSAEERARFRRIEPCRARRADRITSAAVSYKVDKDYPQARRDLSFVDASWSRALTET